MTAPIWMAAPPEVHSALLSTGPGAGSLLAAAGAWHELSAEYASVAQELSAALGTVQGGAWEGPSAESYAAAHVPYLAWLTQESANSAEAAIQHETMAAAYTSALAAMPTLPELAANHAVHGALVATNFFGINTIPIALNELQYVQMWIQAAVTMAIYQAQADAIGVLNQLQNSPGVPPILKQFLDGISDDTLAHDPTIDNPLDQAISQFLQNFGINWNPAEGTVNGLDFDAYTDASQPIFYVVRSLELLEDFQQFGEYLTTNPVFAIQYLISLELFDFPLHIAEVVPYLASQSAVLAVGLGAAVAPVGAVGGLAGLAGLAALPQPVVAAPPLVPAPPPDLLPAAGLAPTGIAAAGAAAPAPAPTPTASSVAGSAPPTPPPTAAGGAAFTPPFAVGPPGIGFGSGMSSSANASASAKKKAPQPDSAAAAVAAAAREQARARRRRRATQRGFGDEFMDMNVGVDPDWTAPKDPEPTLSSDHGAGEFGFAGTASKESTAQPSGLTTLAQDDFGGGPSMPMMPQTWDQ
ncbi:PPE family protein [Mycobacterium kubicae]|uniref:PPE family protein n=1 Tax=Mycobacterium kubicae TaxID=120959 RepID=UPI00163E6055|nr:PPE family protein [Mycobacterium kubicae]QNI05275.1 PPE family protein [Mycobacterium kubicae]